MINEEQKIKINLSNKAGMIIVEDMDIFHTPKTATFLNTVFTNYRSEARASISTYLQNYRLELERLFADTEADSESCT